MVSLTWIKHGLRFLVAVETLSLLISELKMEILYVQVLITVVMASQLSDTITLIGCENTTVSLSCPVGSYMSIIRANYGRFSISVCNHQARQDISTDCTSQENSTIQLSKM